MENCPKGGDMLTGTYQRTLDSKSRITLPSDFRKMFDKQVCLIPLHGVLHGFTPDGFKAWVDNQFEIGDKHYNPRDLNDVRLKRGLTASAQTIELDSAGRVALGKLGTKILSHLGFGHEVTVIGADDHFEIWDAQKWEAENASFEEDFFGLMFGATA